VWPVLGPVVRGVHAKPVTSGSQPHGVTRILVLVACAGVLVPVELAEGRNGVNSVPLGPEPWIMAFGAGPEVLNAVRSRTRVIEPPTSRPSRTSLAFSGQSARTPHRSRCCARSSVVPRTHEDQDDTTRIRVVGRRRNTLRVYLNPTDVPWVDESNNARVRSALAVYVN
jgi:hypothetical protein